MALALFIYLYLNEDTESLIKVVIVADLVRRGSGCQMELCMQPSTRRVARMCAHTGPHSVSIQLIRIRVCTGVQLPLGWIELVAGDQAVCTALAARGWAGVENPRAPFIPRFACEGLPGLSQHSAPLIGRNECREVAPL